MESNFRFVGNKKLRAENDVKITGLISLRTFLKG